MSLEFFQDMSTSYPRFKSSQSATDPSTDLATIRQSALSMKYNVGRHYTILLSLVFPFPLPYPLLICRRVFIFLHLFFAFLLGLDLAYPNARLYFLVFHIAGLAWSCTLVSLEIICTDQRPL